MLNLVHAYITVNNLCVDRWHHRDDEVRGRLSVALQKVNDRESCDKDYSA